MDVLLTEVPWEYLGPGSVLFIAIIAIIKGELIPRRQHETIISLYKETATRERTNADRAMSALRLLSEEQATTTDKFFSSLPVDPKEDDDDS